MFIDMDQSIPRFYCLFPTIPSKVGIGTEKALIREKAMAPHSSTVAWKIPWMEKPGVLQSMGSHRVGHD